jgi:hypothetical protein
MVSINVAYVLNATGVSHDLISRNFATVVVVPVIDLGKMAFLSPQVASETRRLAAEISGLGGTPCVMLLNSWNGRDLKSLNTRIDNLLSSLCGQVRENVF